MNKKLKNIEQLYSESFTNFCVEPSSGLWKNISSKLSWKNFLSFNPTTFNAYYLTGILALSVAGALWITKPVTENNHEIKETSINKTIEKPVITPVPKTQEKTRQPETRNQQPVTSNQQPVTSDQKIDSGINDPKLVTPNLEPITPNSKFETRTLKPVTNLSTLALEKMYNKKTNSSINDQATSNQQPVTTVKYAPSSHFTWQASNQSPDLWPKMDSLFTNQTLTTLQHFIQFPNAFTPNLNGPVNGYYTPGIPNNDVFHPTYKSVVEYHLRIFNRRGELIFESNDINMGWDGYINDRLAAQGVYVWKARGKYSNGQNFAKFGNVMLIKKWKM